ncbi:MAG TPA: UDP-glucose 6-dehydrogenase [Verrucomicrobia bacterium]|mgnify:FL=1|nr:UDP-glucose 6-dehydrogenase [Verrucomicrobiota bacterium]HCG20837.1 UDP-glucose 6-dehydrogenase [Verrucomicrobiota bacterium]
MIKVGIIGCGFVGSALKIWLEENNKDVAIRVSDPPKGYNDDMSDIDVAFVQIHMPTEDDGTQDLTLMKQIIRNLPNVPVFVRTTILPGTSERLTRETGHQVCYMPEFLTQRTYIEDFKRQTMVFTGSVDLLAKIFKGKKFAVMTPLEAEITKYAHNVFGAYKVTYFNAVKEYCEKMGADWANVHMGVLLSGYINETHTNVPGPDGKCGYGGKCFPKDVNAFAKLTAGQPLGTLLAPLHDLNVHFRGSEEHI